MLLFLRVCPFMVVALVGLDCGLRCVWDHVFSYVRCDWYLLGSFLLPLFAMLRFSKIEVVKAYAIQVMLAFQSSFQPPEHE